ncbi:MAG: protein phosphatase 2C domain-containing protein [Gammaproteobacteria bacterium]|nr:protein phosphatase 2C domain-containing protein [Gammaproteobacteria bacterium]
MDDFGSRFAAAQITGKRDYQEDDYGVLDGRADLGIDGSEHTLLLVADGMGGHVSGDTASRLINKTFIETYPHATGPVTDRLRECLDAANQAIAVAIEEKPELDGMGSTLLAVVVSPRGLEWLSIGDSPLWLFRDGHLVRINSDHSMAPVLADMVASGRMTEDEMAEDSNRHMLRSAVMGEEISLIDISSQPRDLKKDDLLLLASDGIMTLGEKQIVNILQEMQGASLEENIVALLRAVEDVALPNQDNATILLYTPEADYGMETVVADDYKSQTVAGGNVISLTNRPITNWTAIFIGTIIFGLLAYILITTL